tara:strand:- start:15 stop:353 length:339 start_codon:yes stop_codon:yes gene_type:complete
MPTFEPGDLVVVPFPFTDSAASKRRPALVISTADFQQANAAVVLAMVTTAKHSRWDGDVKLREWKSAGLPQVSVVRLKLFTLDARFVLRKLGTLASKDRLAVSTNLKQFVGI